MGERKKTTKADFSMPESDPLTAARERLKDPAYLAALQQKRIEREGLGKDEKGRDIVVDLKTYRRSFYPTVDPVSVAGVLMRMEEAGWPLSFQTRAVVLEQNPLSHPKADEMRKAWSLGAEKWIWVRAFDGLSAVNLVTQMATGYLKKQKDASVVFIDVSRWLGDQKGSIDSKEKVASADDMKLGDLTVIRGLNDVGQTEWSTRELAVLIDRLDQEAPRRVILVGRRGPAAFVLGNYEQVAVATVLKRRCIEVSLSV